jgi:hypothetical protein
MKTGRSGSVLSRGVKGALYGALLGANACGGDDSVRNVDGDAAYETPGEAAESSAGNGSAESGTTNEGNSVETGMQREPPDPEATGNGDEPATEEPTSNTPVEPLEVLLSQYRDWQPRTTAPVNVSSDIFTLCRSPTLTESAFVDTEHGQSRMLMDWLNPAAHAGFEALGDQGFAPGAAIVKEKLSYRDGVPEPVLVAIGIMLKHERGFDSEHGDWEFAYWEEAPGLLASPDQSAYCAACHASSLTDFVFLDDSWRDSSDEE